MDTRILLGKLNVVKTVKTSNLDEVTLRNRNKDWYRKRSEGRYPFLDPDYDERADD